MMAARFSSGTGRLELAARWMGVASAIVMAGLGGCGGDPPTGTKVDPSTLVWQIRSDPDGAVTMAKGDSLQLALTGINVDNQSIPINGGTLTFTSDDDNFVAVTQTGMVHAVQPTNGTPLKIVASYQNGGAIATDTTYVAVTPTRETVHAIEFRPDSTRTAWGFPPFSPHVVALGPDGAVLPDVFVGVYTARGDATASATPEIGEITFNTVGPQWVYASVLAYGTRWTDSLQVTVLQTWLESFEFIPAGNSLTVSGAAGAVPSRTMQPCGQIYFFNDSNLPVNVTFDAPATPVTCALADGDTTVATPLALQPNGGYGIRKLNGLGTTTWIARRTDASADSVASGTILTK